MTVWQTQLRGRHANQTLIEYMPSGNFVGKLFSKEGKFPAYSLCVRHHNSIYMVSSLDVDISYADPSPDTFWGQLGGCLEMIDCGTTTVADFAHINMSGEHNHNAISATVASGIRSSFGFCPNPRLSSTTPFEIDVNGLGGHSMPTLETLAAESPWGNGRVTLGFAFDGFAYLPREVSLFIEYSSYLRQYDVVRC